MKYVEVKTQAALDKALAKLKPDEIIVLVGDGIFSFSGFQSPTVVARDSSSPRVVARGSSSPTVVALGSSSPTVVARESSSPRVEAWGSSSPRVEAWGSSSPSGSVGKYAALLATTRDQAKMNIPGATILEVPEITTAEEWCDYHGVLIKRGTATLYKAVRDDFRSHNGGDYTPGTKPKAADWDGGEAECGGGLHFSPHPAMALEFDGYATRFVACPVRVAEVRAPQPSDVYPQKVKAPRCSGAVYEVDIDGERV